MEVYFSRMYPNFWSNSSSDDRFKVRIKHYWDCLSGLVECDWKDLLKEKEKKENLYWEEKEMKEKLTN